MSKGRILIHSYPSNMGVQGFWFQNYKQNFEYLGYEVRINEEGFTQFSRRVDQDLEEWDPDIFIFTDVFLANFNVMYYLDYRKSHNLKTAAMLEPFHNPRNNTRQDFKVLEFVKQGLTDIILTFCLPVDYTMEIYKEYNLPVCYFGPSFNHLEEQGLCNDLSEYEKVRDLIFIGKSSAVKNDYFNRLQQSAAQYRWSLDMFGVGWPGGPLSYKDMILEYRRSKIAPNIHHPGAIVNQVDFNGRNIESLGSGCFTICDALRGARTFFNDDELPIADSFDEYLKMIEYFLSREEERNKYIEKGRKKVLESHTTLIRCQDLLDSLYLESTIKKYSGAWEKLANK